MGFTSEQEQYCGGRFGGAEKKSIWVQQTQMGRREFVCFVFYSETESAGNAHTGCDSVPETMSLLCLLNFCVWLAVCGWKRTAFCDKFADGICGLFVDLIRMENIKHSNHWSHKNVEVYQNCHLSPNIFLIESSIIIIFVCNLTKNILFGACCSRRIIHEKFRKKKMAFFCEQRYKN